MAISQPALSRLIALLESDLGFALFRRRPGQPLQPTEEADAFYVEVNRMYVALDHLQQVGSEIRSFRRDHLRVAGTPFLANSLLALATAHFMHDFPDSAVSIDARPHNEVVAMVASRQHDLGVIVLPVAHSGIDIQRVMTVQSYGVVAADHPLAAREKLKLADLNGEHFVSNIFGSQLQESGDAMLRKRGIEPRRRIFVRNQEIACSLIAQGCGISILTPPFPSHVAHYPGIRFRPFHEKLRNDIGIITSNLRPPNRAVSHFIEKLRAVAEQQSRIRYDD